jgi:exocyst complex protein 7
MYDRSEVKEMLGDDWLQRHRRIVQQHATLYQRIAWNKALSYITGSALMSSSSISLSSGANGIGLIGGTGDNGGVSKTQLKERLKNFNSILEDLHRTQMQWTVWDTDLRDAMRLQVAEVLLPAYRSFIKRYRSIHPLSFPIIICLK